MKLFTASLFVLFSLIPQLTAGNGQVTSVQIESGKMTVNYTQPKAFDANFYVPEVSGSVLGPWSSANASISEKLASDDGLSLYMKATDATLAATTLQRFLRLRTIPAPTTSPAYTSIITSNSTWLTGSSTLADGAIFYTTVKIVPYYGNISAIGLTKSPANYPAVKKWMQWYIAHLNATDIWSLGGTIYDYDLNGTTETSQVTADSTDSYAATFLNLAWVFWQTGDSDARTYLQSIKTQLNSIGHVIINTQQGDGLTWAKPDYQIKYLMDNCEAFQGLQSASNLFRFGFADTATADIYANAASVMSVGIESQLWNAGDNCYKTYAGRSASAPQDWTLFYPDATAQLFPVLCGVISPTSSRAISLYAQFNANFPNWPLLHKSEFFPWALVSVVAAMMNDVPRANTYLATCATQFGANQFPWPWHNAESGWLLQACKAMSLLP